MAKRIRKKNIVEFDQVSQRWIIEAMIICDTESDLPTADEFDNYHIAQGSLAVVVETSDRFRIKSDGTWEKMTYGSGSSPSFVKKEITENGTYNATDDSADGFYSVVVDVPKSGGGNTTATRKDVNFYDYDGTIVYSYTKNEFASLTAMPDNPSHEGLTAQGWNWSLSDAKTYVSNYGKLEIGQMYITSDGKTRLYITLTEGRTSPIMTLYLNANTEVDIDWGDGTAYETLTTESAGYVSSGRHNYASAGDYVITIAVGTGSIIIQQSSPLMKPILSNGDNSASSPDQTYLNSIKRIEFGSRIGVGSYAFNYCYSLSSITIPSSVTSIGTQAFSYCYSLSSITIPSSVTSIGHYTFYNCNSLSSIILSPSVTSIGNNVFYNCNSLSSITIPPSVTSIGNNVFYNCYSLSSITIPPSVTSIRSAVFSGCYSLATITINSAEGSISGSPWGAKTSAPTNTQIVWTG